MDVETLERLADEFVVGDDPRLAAKLSAAAGALFVLTFLLHVPARIVGPLSAPFALFRAVGVLHVTLFAVMFVAAAVGSYLNDGLLVSVALAAGPSMGFYFAAVLFDHADLGEAVLRALVIGVVSAVVLGALGFVVGSTLRHAAS